MFLFFIFSALPAFARPATNDPPALVPAYGEIRPTFLEQHGTLVIIGSFALIVLAALVLWKMLQPKPPVVLPPEVLARGALTKLLRQPEDGKLLSEVSQILRRYLGSAFQMPGAELTTAEFCSGLARNDKIDLQLGESVSSFLRECDMRKFSPASAAPPLDAVNRALNFVNDVEKLSLQTDSNQLGGI